MYDLGEGVIKDSAEAARWFRKSAEQGNVVVQAVLGYMYAMVKGVPKDYVQAYM